MLSRLAKMPIDIPDDVLVSLKGTAIKVKGKLGELDADFGATISLSVESKQIVINTTETTKFAKALSGTASALIKNMLVGVSKGFEKKLTILGVGYRAALAGANLNLTLGYSHPVTYQAPQGIKLAVPSQTEITISGIDKQVVGQVAANIRALRPVEPYKGKGIRYADEEVILKETKKK